jgi:hypothetical protein
MAGEFMISIHNRLKDEKKLAESTAVSYLRTLSILNGRKPFRTLTFLTKTDDIQAKLSKYAETTQQALRGAIISVLSLYPDKAPLRKAMDTYRDVFKTNAKDIREKMPEDEKTEKQKKVWIEWPEVEERLKELQARTAAIKPKKAINEEEWKALQDYTLLALYTMMKPRRNKDFLEMTVVGKLTPALPKDNNYYAAKDGRFRFGAYKTSGTYGEQEITAPEDLKEVLSRYIAHHPLNKDKRRLPNFPLLVSFDGTPWTAGNAITRALNRIFGKAIGSSMLRHIWLTGRWGKAVEEMKEDAAAMAHSTTIQRRYIKKGKKEAEVEAPKNEVVEVVE